MVAEAGTTASSLIPGFGPSPVRVPVVEESSRDSSTRATRHSSRRKGTSSPPAAIDTRSSEPVTVPVPAARGSTSESTVQPSTHTGAAAVSVCSLPSRTPMVIAAGSPSDPRRRTVRARSTSARANRDPATRTVRSGPVRTSGSTISPGTRSPSRAAPAASAPPGTGVATPNREESTASSASWPVPRCTTAIAQAPSGSTWRVTSSRVFVVAGATCTTRSAPTSSAACASRWAAVST